MTFTSRVVSGGGGLLLMAAVAIGTSACGPSDSASGGSSASSAPATTSSAAASASSSAAGGTVDVASLVIKPSDIPIPGFTQTASTPLSQSGANGVAVSFANADGTRQVGDTIVTLPDANSAKAALDAAMNAAKGELQGVKSGPAQFGDGGYLLSGTKSGKSATVLIFQQGKAFVVMEFASAANDPVPDDVVNAVGQKQADLIKAGMPG